MIIFNACFQKCNNNFPLISIILNSCFINRFQNTFFSIIKRSIKIMQIDGQKFQVYEYNRQNSIRDFHKEGLPNLGNTCYLNSILQFLYSSKEFRKMIEDNIHRNNQSTLTRCIYNIFSNIEQGEFIEKYNCLKKIIEKIQEIERRIICLQQQDFLQILMLILNQLFSENQGLEELFQFQTENKCRCGFHITFNMFLMNNKQVCLSCGSYIQTMILKGSNLIIVSNQNVVFNHFESYLMKTFTDSKLVYRCIAKIFYIGNAQVGHYRASRLCEGNKFIEFSDSSGYQEYDRFPLYLLLQKVTVQKPVSFVLHPTISENSPITIGKVYRSKLNLIHKVTANNNIRKRQKIVYFVFEQALVQNGFQVQINILNKDQLGVSVYSVKKKYDNRNVLRHPALHIVRFLEQQEQRINQKLLYFFQRGSHQKKSFFSKSSYENSLSQNDFFKELPFVEVIRNS